MNPSCLAADVRAYGQWMRDQAEQRIGHLYPQATLPDGTTAPVIAWIWARTVTCPNPGCRIEMPLVRSWWLGKKKGKEAYIIPTVTDDPNHPSGKRITYTIGHDTRTAPTKDTDGTVGRTGATCIACSSPVDLKYIRAHGRTHGLGQQLMAIVAEGQRRRIYLSPVADHEESAVVTEPVAAPTGTLAANPRDFKTPNYGMSEFSDLFTPRQLVALTTFSDLVGEARERAMADGASVAYAEAIATYLGLAVSRTLNKSTAVCTWDSSPKMEAVRGLFARQAIPMAWDFAEANTLGTSSGNYLEDVGWVARALDRLPRSGGTGTVSQADAATRGYGGVLVATDPPYYDNIGYSDLSDFFYVWLRRSLRSVHPELFSTLLVPKAEELVANPYRHDGKPGAQQFFESGFKSVFARARESAFTEFPITVWYAFKQSDSDDSGQGSTGWETLLEGMIESGWEITSTWPNRSELGNRMIASGTNALASSIVLSLRPRAEGAPVADRRGFIAALEAELPGALRWLQQGQIAPVDLPQAAIGPGMAVFSRFSRVVEPDGSTMSVRSALQRINEILDRVLNEQEGDFDPPTRFAIAWYRQHGYTRGKYGDADNLARARNTSVETMDREGILSSRAGTVELLSPAALEGVYDPAGDAHISVWEVLHQLIRALGAEGLAGAGALLQRALSRDDAVVDADLVKELGHLLFRIAEANSWTKDALAFNTVVTSWPEIIEAAGSSLDDAATQQTLDFDEY